MDEDPPAVVFVLLHPVVSFFDLFSFQEFQDPFFQLTAPFPGYQFEGPGLFLDRFLKAVLKGLFDLSSVFRDRMEI